MSFVSADDVVLVVVTDGSDRKFKNSGQREGSAELQRIAVFR